MKIGDLVKTTRFSVGIPNGAVGLIVSAKDLGWTKEKPFVIHFLKEDKHGIHHYIYFKEDLEVLSES